jgi:FMN phosphatase YigB (HAD superfamily)/DNA-binding XRE family transcriptional regulator
MDELSLGKQLQAARQAASLTQQQLCHKANLSFSTLTKIERGAIKSPSIFTIQAIADALNVSLDELIGQSVSAGSHKKFKKTKGGVSFVYFDVNGCLIYFYQRAFDKLAVDAGVNAEVVESAFWRYNDDVCRGEMSLSDFNVKLAKHIGIDSVKWQQYYLENVEPIVEMQKLLVWASERYHVGLLTNIMPGFLQAMRRNQQLPNINYSAIIDSSEVDTIKPEAKMYEIAGEKAGYPPGEILLIDDSRANLAAASRLGWHALWFDDSRLEESVNRASLALEPAED